MPMATREEQREYQRVWAAKRRAKWFADKACVKCGSINDLELDHIDPATKILQPATLWGMAAGNPRRISELAKCQVLCHLCHEEKSKHEHAKGQRNGAAKLTEAKVIEIRCRYKMGGTSHRKLALEYGVAKATIKDVISRKNWKI